MILFCNIFFLNNEKNKKTTEEPNFAGVFVWGGRCPRHPPTPTARTAGSLRAAPGRTGPVQALTPPRGPFQTLLPATHAASTGQDHDTEVTTDSVWGRSHAEPLRAPHTPARSCPFPRLPRNVAAAFCHHRDTGRPGNIFLSSLLPTVLMRPPRHMRRGRFGMNPPPRPSPRTLPMAPGDRHPIPAQACGPRSARAAPCLCGAPRAPTSTGLCGLTVSACRTKSRRWGCSRGGFLSSPAPGAPVRGPWSRVALKQVFLKPQMDG